MSDAIGCARWAIAAGHAPARSRGVEPAFTSHDRLCLLNAGAVLANVRVRVLYAAGAEVGPYRLSVAPRRMRHVRVNDLIFPEAIRLDEAYGLIVRSDQPVVVQFSRQDTRALMNAGMMTTAWPGID
ncbi:hypothetical protein IP90_02297 [Luteimonas cucumeris]|uniref:Sensory rhodopsin transducer n=1 Tax=Luteimonas cucumeris TaxID=985012 RepID=A0A562L272_9GAMM|nr:sensory rhodopsin transducer [Luteimonas cucumeris]TWI01737.1 hypothetical protein IP90_02297 [Luteimonas cucumeris]